MAHIQGHREELQVREGHVHAVGAMQDWTLGRVIRAYFIALVIVEFRPLNKRTVRNKEYLLRYIHACNVTDNKRSLCDKLMKNWDSVFTSTIKPSPK